MQLLRLSANWDDILVERNSLACAICQVFEKYEGNNIFKDNKTGWLFVGSVIWKKITKSWVWLTDNYNLTVNVGATLLEACKEGLSPTVGGLRKLGSSPGIWHSSLVSRKVKLPTKTGHWLKKNGTWLHGIETSGLIPSPPSMDSPDFS